MPKHRKGADIDRASSELQKATGWRKRRFSHAKNEPSTSELSDQKLDTNSNESGDDEDAVIYLNDKPAIPSTSADPNLDSSESDNSDNEDDAHGLFHNDDERPVPSVRYDDCGDIYSSCCSSCGAFKFRDEKPGFCCGTGASHRELDPMPELPACFQELYEGQHYRANIRTYNNAFAMASLRCDTVQSKGFSPILKIHGKIHHYVGPWRPQSGENPKFAQIYFYDQEHETANRAHDDILKPKILETIQSFLRQNNRLVTELGAAINTAEKATMDYNIVLIAKKGAPSTYDLPSSNQIAALVAGDQCNYFDVLMRKQSGGVQRINEMHQCYDPLHYVLLLPYGTPGYSLGERDKNDKPVTVAQYYCYHLQLRKDSFNHFLRSGRLSQQYFCDMKAKVDGYRLKWIVNNQKAIRADKYNGLIDAVENNDEQNAGKTVILPPSVYESMRWYAEVFQDAMALVRRFGKPDYFITMTCNPKWPEILRSLAPGEFPADRPDIYIRVFHIKVQKLLKVLVQQQPFGEVAAYTCMKEDQKRGLPHVHILLICKKGSKPRNGDDIAKVISAQLPPETDTELMQVIKRHNVHGPCGRGVNDKSPCMKNGSCSKKFPKMFVDAATHFTQETYAVLQRKSPDNGGGVFELAMSNGVKFTVDNRWIVPYNRQLSLTFNCHLNVEAVHSTSSVKYIYKYTCKGSDKASFAVKENDGGRNEVENYLNGRYVLATAALWRLFGFEILNRWPMVEKLPLHLPQEQMVMFEPEEARAIVASGPPETKLTAFFKLCQEDPATKNLRYVDVPRRYRWNGSSHKWISRKRRLAGVLADSEDMSPAVGRVPVIGLTPRQKELYFLRILLHHITGPKSFDDLKIVNGEKLTTYQDACIKLGIIKDSEELDNILQEAGSCQFGNVLRELFAFLLLFWCPPDPVGLFNRHKVTLCEDLMRKSNSDSITQPIKDQCLGMIDSTLRDNGMSLVKDFGFPKFSNPLDQMPTHLMEEQNYDIQTLTAVHEESYPMLTDEQHKVYEPVVTSVLKEQGRTFALSARAGTGKTFTLQTILSRIRRDGHIALATAVSGIAAILLPNGRTLHSRCKVPLNVTETSTCNLSRRDGPGKLLIAAKLLVIDEVTMGHRYIFETLDRSLRFLRQSEKLFGGLTVLLSGDWHQILPVVPKGGRADIVNATLKNSYIWPQTTKLTLTKNMRVMTSNDDNLRDFAEFLAGLGEGSLGESKGTGMPRKVKVPEHMTLPGNTLEELQQFVFGPNFDTMDKCILAPLNEDVDAVNLEIMKKFPGEMYLRLSADFLCDESEAYQYPIEFLNKIQTAGLPAHKLQLKLGCPIMLIRNLNPTKGHCNGTRYRVNNILRNVIDATITTGMFVGKSVLIPRIPFVTDDPSLPFQMTRLQYPIRPCFAITINKGQGQSLKKTGLYLKNQVFSHGQLYVAFSRATNPNGIKVLAPKDANGDMFVDNVVYDEVLRD